MGKAKEMAKHNNAIQRPHLRKNWQINVKTYFDQPAQKKRRLLKRREKANTVFPRPLKKLRSVVRKSTQRYSSQTRLGRGFTLKELKNVGLNINFARSIGISVDHRRTNKSVQTFQENCNRLRNYLEKLVLLPKRNNMPKKGNNGVLSDFTENVELVQNDNIALFGNGKSNNRVKSMKITKEMNEFRAHSQLRLEKMNKKWAGKRAARANKKD